MRLSNRLFQSSRSTVLGAESQVLAGVLQRQGALYQLPTPTSKKDMTRATLTCLFTSTQISPMLHCCAEPALAFGDLPLLLPQGQGQSLAAFPPCSTPSSQAAYPLVPRFLPVNHCWLSALLAMPRLASASCHQKERQGLQGSVCLRCHSSGLLWHLCVHGHLQQCIPAAQPPPTGITRLTCSFSTSSFVSSTAHPAWPCSAAIWWKNLRHFTSTSENRTCGDRAPGETPRLEPPVLPGLRKITHTQPEADADPRAGHLGQAKQYRPHTPPSCWDL